MRADADIGADNKNSHKKACIEQAFIVSEILISWAIGQKVLMTNPNKPDSYLNDVARSIQLHLPT